MRPSSGVTAHWKLEPPVYTPTSRRIATAARPMTWSSLHETSWAEPIEGAVLGERDREVEPGLPAERGQERLRPLALDDLGHELRRQRLHVRAVGRLRVGHDGGRVRVDEHDLEPLFAQRLARLRPRIVELARLPDHDRPRPDQQDLP